VAKYARRTAGADGARLIGRQRSGVEACGGRRLYNTAVCPAIREGSS